MMNKIVWSDEDGDLRKTKDKMGRDKEVDEASLELCLRRLTSGKGRVIIEISGLPTNKAWCKKLAKDLKKKLGVGGAYKNKMIEVHGEKLDLVANILEKKSLKWKKIGG